MIKLKQSRRIFSMAEQYNNTNRFALFKGNKDKESQPDYTGTITLEGGKEMRLSAWLKESKSGVTYMSGQMSEPYDGAKTNTQSAPQEPITEFKDLKDDIPF